MKLESILERLSHDGSVAVGELTGTLEAPAATMRRDLGLLEQQCLLSRTHGGAVGNGTLYELPVRYRGGRRVSEKRRIAEAATARIGHERSGAARSRSHELIGPLADATVAALNLDLLLIGVERRRGGGMTTHDVREAQTDRRMVGRARRAIVVRDSSKIGRAALSVICGAGDGDVLIADSAAPAEMWSR